MSKRLIVCRLMMIILGLTSLPVSQAQVSTQSNSVKLSAYRDDPFVNEPRVERVDASMVNIGRQKYPNTSALANSRMEVLDEAIIYREDRTTHQYKPFAWNPWPEATENNQGNFKFQDEARFPLFEIVRGEDGKPILRDGLQVWKPLDLYLGMTTAFKAANDDKDAAESWAGRNISWGNLGLLGINSHSFTDFNAFYSPTARQVFLGVAAYKLPGETTAKMFETASSWEMPAHECGHALHHALKPNIDLSDKGYRTWSESFADQTAMWVSLGDPQRVRAVLAETAGNLYSSNALSRFVEAFAALVGKGTAERDAFHTKKISDTTDEVHDRSEVLTGAVYKVFTLIYNDLKGRQGGDERPALTQAGDMMGIFLMRSTDYTSENLTTLEDVGKAYLKIDKEFFGGRYHTLFVDEFIKREIFDVDSEAEWMEHEAAVPSLRLPKRASDQDVDNLVQANLDKLGVGPNFGLKLQSVIRDDRFKQTIVRVQLTEGRGDGAAPLDNHGILTFRADRTMADYHSPLPAARSHAPMAMQAKAQMLMDAAKGLRLDQHGAPLSIVRRADGRLTIEAKVMRSEGFICWIEAFTPEHPEGERREVITRTFARQLVSAQPGGVQILTADDLDE